MYTCTTKLGAFAMVKTIQYCDRELSSPLQSFATERLYGIPRGGAPHYTGPGLQEYWGEAYWAAIRRGARPGWAMTYGPGPHAYRPPGRAQLLLWKNLRGRKGERG